jgi:hypothetical protein
MATTNNQLPVRRFDKQYAGLLSSVFNATAAFRGAFAPLQTVDGITHNTIAFSVKTNNTPVVFNTYDTSANSGGFGDGTGAKSRFGQRTEIKYTDTDVLYDNTWAYDEGIDLFTVNNDADTAIAERMELIAQAQTRRMNTRLGQFLSTSAGNAITNATIDATNVETVFTTLSSYYVNAEVTPQVFAYVSPDVYNVILKHPLTTTEKNTSTNIDTGNVVMFMGFVIVREPAKYFGTNDVAYFSPQQVALPFVGIEEARVLNVLENATGQAIQGAGKEGNFITDDNKLAVSKWAKA